MMNLRSTRLARQAESFIMCMSLPVVLACYLDSGETRIIKIRIAKKNTESLKNRNVLCMQKFLALRYNKQEFVVYLSVTRAGMTWICHNIICTVPS